MKMYKSVFRILCPLAAISTVVSTAAPGISQDRIAPVQPETAPSGSVQVRPDVLQGRQQGPVVGAPVKPDVINDSDLPLDDPWTTFCLMQEEEGGEELANCLNGLP